MDHAGRARRRLRQCGPWLALTGTTERLVPIEEFLRCVHPDDRERIGIDWGAARAAGAPFAMHYRIRGGDGVDHWSLMRAVPIVQHGVITGWLGTLLDVEAERSARARVAEVENRSLSLANAIPAARRRQRCRRVAAARQRHLHGLHGLDPRAGA